MSDLNPVVLDSIASLARLEHRLRTEGSTQFEAALAAGAAQLGDKLEEYLRQRWGQDAEMIEQATDLREWLRRGLPGKVSFDDWLRSNKTAG